MSDYFSAQSNGLFNLSFDVVGPVRMSKNSTYYGGTSKNGDDEPVDELVKEACRKVDDQVNFANYDWSGNGEVDQVFILYAGKGQADGGANNTIWPHEYWLSAYPGGSHITLDGKKIDTYACSSELNGQNGLSGIGTICHEFSHCLGLPDWYDVYYSGNFGMCDFSLMDMGSYLGDGMTPPPPTTPPGSDGTAVGRSPSSSRPTPRPLAACCRSPRTATHTLSITRPTATSITSWKTASKRDGT